ncbi:hypothetical protein PINS_up015226 [Pythium insidiosum]|nr:hypothetical protein PINS_up015226 [Pythium insidiosum]
MAAAAARTQTRALATMQQPFVPEETGEEVPHRHLQRRRRQYLFDAQGNKYLDFCAGIAVSGLGHSDPDWFNALVAAGKGVCHTSNLYHTESPLRLAKTLVDNSCFDKVFFCNSGTEANEGAFSLRGCTRAA